MKILAMNKSMKWPTRRPSMKLLRFICNIEPEYPHGFLNILRNALRR
jgi:hypothetical protein